MPWPTAVGVQRVLTVQQSWDKMVGKVDPPLQWLRRSVGQKCFGQPESDPYPIADCLGTLKAPKM